MAVFCRILFFLRERRLSMSENKSWYKKGLRDGIPIALGYFAVAFTLGIAASKAGLSAFEAGLAAALTNASAGGYAGITLIAASAGYIEMALTQLIVNARYLLMSCALSQKLAPETPLIHRLLIAFDVTDEIFGICNLFRKFHKRLVMLDALLQLTDILELQLEQVFDRLIGKGKIVAIFESADPAEPPVLLRVESREEGRRRRDRRGRIYRGYGRDFPLDQEFRRLGVSPPHVIAKAVEEDHRDLLGTLKGRGNPLDRRIGRRGPEMLEEGRGEIDEGVPVFEFRYLCHSRT